MALDRLMDLLARRFLYFSCIFRCFNYRGATDNFWAHNNIVFDLI